MIKFTIRICLFAALLLSAFNGWSQGMAVNTSGSAADNSAMLDVSSTSRGVLVPRMTAAQKIAISSPATGLLIYQTDGTAGFYYYNGTAWTAVSGTGSSSSNALDLSVTNSLQTAPAATTVDIQFDNVITAPTTGSFNTSTYSYTVGATGDYLIQFNVMSATLNTLVYPQLTLNGVVSEYAVASFNNNLAPYPGRGSLSVVRHLAVNDVIKVQLVNTSGTNAASLTGGASKFSVIKL